MANPLSSPNLPSNGQYDITYANHRAIDNFSFNCKKVSPQKISKPLNKMADNIDKFLSEPQSHIVQIGD